MRALLDDSFAAFKHELKQELQQELKQDFDDSLAAHRTRVADMLAAYERDVVGKLEQTEARIISTVQNEFGNHWNNTEQNMMERVREEMAEAQDDIMQYSSLQNANPKGLPSLPNLSSLRPRTRELMSIYCRPRKVFPMFVPRESNWKFDI